MHAMLASGTTFEDWFFDNGATHHLAKDHTSLSNVHAYQFSCPHTPEQNGRAERKIRHLVETGLALSAQASLPLKYWMQSFQKAAYLINLLPTKVLSYQSPIQLLFHKALNYTHLLIFGCLCFPSLRPYMTNKLSYGLLVFFLDMPHLIKAIFVLILKLIGFTSLGM